jgi:hypothetical protein
VLVELAASHSQLLKARDSERFNHKQTLEGKSKTVFISLSKIQVAAHTSPLSPLLSLLNLHHLPPKIKTVSHDTKMKML